MHYSDHSNFVSQERLSTTGHATQRNCSLVTSQKRERLPLSVVAMVETLYWERNVSPWELPAVLPEMKAGLLNTCWYVIFNKYWKL